MWLNFEHTKSSNRSKRERFPKRRKSNSNLPIHFKTPEIVRIGVGPNGNVLVESLFQDRTATNTAEVLVKSLFQDRPASWVRIVNGVDVYVTEYVQTKEVEDITLENPLLEQDQGKSQQRR